MYGNGYMNEGIFRGKTVKGGVYVYGAYLNHLTRTPCPMDDEATDDDFVDLIITSGFSDWNMPKPLEVHKVVSKSIGKFTGMKDRKKIRAFEGDIFQDKSGETYGRFAILHLKGGYGIFKIGEGFSLDGDYSQAVRSNDPSVFEQKQKTQSPSIIYLI